MFRRNSEIVDIIIDGKTYPACKKLVSGGSKTIFDLGDGHVIGVARATFNDLHRFIDREVALSKKLSNLGLLTQAYEKITASINGKTLPVFKMPHFSTLATRGIQVRDSKNNESSCGNSTIFGSLDHLTNPKHWHLILKDIAHDIAVYLLNHFDFHSDSFNLAIVDTQATASARATSQSALFSDLQQAIHLYFFDFSDINSLYNEKIHYEFLDLDGIDGSIIVNESQISAHINELKSKIQTTVLLAVSEDEYAGMLSTQTDVNPSYSISLQTMEKLSKQAFQNSWDEFVLRVKNEVMGYINHLSASERMDRYATDLLKRRIKSIEETRSRFSY